MTDPTLYTPEDFLDSRVGTLPAINNPRTVTLTVQPGHRDQLPSNYCVARRVEPEAKFFNDFSRARACARAQGDGRSGSPPPLNPDRRMRSRWRLVLRIRLTITAEPSGGGHALLKGRETAICPAVVEAAVNRTPRIILGFGAHSNSGDADTNPEDE
jgi:hypothetical protein